MGIEILAARVYAATIGKFGPWVAIASVLAIAVIYAGWYWLRILADIKKRDAESRDAMRVRDAESRDKERAMIIDELSKTREQMDVRNEEHSDQIADLIKEHFTHDKVERETIAKTMVGISEDLKAHRTEEGRRAEKLYDKFDEIGKSISESLGFLRGHNA